MSGDAAAKVDAFIKNELALLPTNKTELIESVHFLLMTPSERTIFFQQLAAVCVYVKQDGDDPQGVADAIEKVMSAFALLVVAAQEKLKQ